MCNCGRMNQIFSSYAGEGHNEWKGGRSLCGGCPGAARARVFAAFRDAAANAVSLEAASASSQSRVAPGRVGTHREQLSGRHKWQTKTVRPRRRPRRDVRKEWQWSRGRVLSETGSRRFW